MPCNANNHPPDCNCGWGQVFYGHSEDPIEPDWMKESSYTTPNARCPQCGERVYFFRSEQGGAVYFDDLGPPWPKHPCTDTELKDQRLSAGLNRREAGWWPLLRERSIWGTLPLPGHEGALIYDSQERCLLVKGKYKVLKENMPVLMRKMPGQPNVYQVTTLRTAKGKTSEVIYNAYKAEALANPAVAQHFQKTIAWLKSLEPQQTENTRYE